MKRATLILKVTNLCNLKCKYCYNSEKQCKSGFANLDYIYKMLSLMKGFEHINVIFHGGEPLLGGIEFYKEVLKIEEVITNNYGNTFTNGVQTNGTLLTDEYISFFKKNKISVGFSFDGIYNEEYRGGTEKTLKAMAKYKLQNKDAGCLAVVVDKNYSMKENYEYFKKLNLSFKFCKLFIEGSAKDLDDSLPNDEYTNQLCELFDYWIYDKDGIEVTNFIEIIYQMFHYHYSLCSNASCIGSYFSLDVDGNISGCSRENVGHIVFANIKDVNSFGDILNSKNFIEYVKSAIERRNSCKESCKLYDYCVGGCNDDAAIAGDIAKPNKEYCKSYIKLFTTISEKINKILEDKTDLANLNPAFVKAYKQTLGTDETL